jgi:hypothetical protein
LSLGPLIGDDIRGDTVEQIGGDLGVEDQLTVLGEELDLRFHCTGQVQLLQLTVEEGRAEPEQVEIILFGHIGSPDDW